MPAGTWPPYDLLDESGYHWLHAERSQSASIARWMGNMWYCINESQPITPQQMRGRGWEYLGPVAGRPYSCYLDN